MFLRIFVLKNQTQFFRLDSTRLTHRDSQSEREPSEDVEQAADGGDGAQLALPRQHHGVEGAGEQCVAAEEKSRRRRSRSNGRRQARRTAVKDDRSVMV